jgi:hypothetical protein
MPHFICKIQLLLGYCGVLFIHKFLVTIFVYAGELGGFWVLSFEFWVLGFGFRVCNYPSFYIMNFAF